MVGKRLNPIPGGTFVDINEFNNTFQVTLLNLMVYIKTNTYYPRRFVSRCGDLQGEGLQLIARFFARAVLVVREGGGLRD